MGCLVAEKMEENRKVKELLIGIGDRPSMAAGSKWPYTFGSQLWCSKFDPCLL